MTIAVGLVVGGGTAPHAKSRAGWFDTGRRRRANSLGGQGYGNQFGERDAQTRGTYSSIKLAAYPPKVHCAPSGKRTSIWPPSSSDEREYAELLMQPVILQKHGDRIKA